MHREIILMYSINNKVLLVSSQAIIWLSNKTSQKYQLTEKEKEAKKHQSQRSFTPASLTESITALTLP